jgi:hypothetical protein
LTALLFGDLLVVDLNIGLALLDHVLELQLLINAPGLLKAFHSFLSTVELNQNIRAISFYTNSVIGCRLGMSLI